MKTCHTKVMEYYSAIKKIEIMKIAGIQISTGKNIRELTQATEDHLHVSILIQHQIQDLFPFVIRERESGEKRERLRERGCEVGRRKLEWICSKLYHPLPLCSHPPSPPLISGPTIVDPPWDRTKPSVCRRSCQDCAI